jgi:hypothetical protein
MVSLLLTCSTTWLSLIAAWCLLGAAHRGQPWMPAWTLPHVRDGLCVRLMAVWCTFRRPCMCHPVHRQCMRNEWRDSHSPEFRVVYLDLAGNSTAPKIGYNAPLSHQCEGALP